MIFRLVNQENAFVLKIRCVSFGSEADSAIVSKATRRCVNGRLGEEEEHDTRVCQEIWARGQGFISDRIVAESTAESLNGPGRMEIFLSQAVRNER